MLAASPLVALPLAVGGVDLPLIGLCCFGLALAAKGRPVGAGLALAFACTLKWTVWPALPVALVLLRALYGCRVAGRAALVAGAGGGRAGPVRAGRTAHGAGAGGPLSARPVADADSRRQPAARQTAQASGPAGIRPACCCSAWRGPWSAPGCCCARR